VEIGEDLQIEMCRLRQINPHIFVLYNLISL